MNLFLAVAPAAQVAHGALGCMVSLDDLADRPPRPMADGDVLDLGGKRVRHIDTPHVPHGWEARVLFEETTDTLLCGDLFAHLGNGPALTEGDIVEPAAAAEDVFRASSLHPSTVATVRGLAELNPNTLALMHGSSFAGDGATALQRLADDYETRITAASPRLTAFERILANDFPVVRRGSHGNAVRPCARLHLRCLCPRSRSRATAAGGRWARSVKISMA